MVGRDGDRRGRRRLAGAFVVAVTLVVAGSGCAPRGAWTVVATPTEDPPGDERVYRPVSCVTATSCISAWSVPGGYDERVVAASWDGDRWTALPDIPVGETDGSSVDSLDCGGPGSCVATVGMRRRGEDSDWLLATWDGSSWAVIPAPGSDEPFSRGWAPHPRVSCGGPRSCLATGNTQVDGQISTWALVWDGTTWSPVPGPPVPRLASALENELSCAGPSFCVQVVGSAQVGVPSAIWVWDGATWAAASLPPPPGGTGTFDFSLVDCPAADACVVLGSLNTGSTNAAGLPDMPTVAMRWNGRTWSPHWLGPWAMPRTVSCPTATRCLAFLDQFIAPLYPVDRALELGGPRPASRRSTCRCPRTRRSRSSA